MIKVIASINENQIAIGENADVDLPPDVLIVLK